jgi:ATP-dependent Lon protease
MVGRPFAGDVMAPDKSQREETFEAPAIIVDDAIVFPEMEVSMAMHEPRSTAAATQAYREHSLIVLVPSSNSDTVVGSIGTLVLLHRTPPAKGSAAQSLWKGLWRVKVDEVIAMEPYVRVRFSKAGATEDVPSDTTMMKSVFEQIDEFFEAIPGIPTEIISFLKNVDRPGKLADLCAYSPFFTRGERLELLRTLDPDERLEKVHHLFEKQLNELKRVAKTTSILECQTCMDLADKAFEAGPAAGARVATEFLDHVARDHPEELLALIAERYGPSFMRRRALK